MTPKRIIWTVLILALLGVILALSVGPTGTCAVPEQRDDGWRTASLAEVGINDSEIRKAVERIQDGTYPNVHSLLIVKDGRLVFEAYFGGYRWAYDDPLHRGEWVDFDTDTIHNLASVTKSFTSALVGIAIDRGAIQAVDDSVFDYFPQHADLRSADKAALTLEHLLTMTSGLAWNEMELPYSDRTNDLITLFYVADPVHYVLAQPLIHQPGTSWYYNGGGTNVLGEVIREATGRRMDDFAGEVLFEPLGITDYQWDFLNSDTIHASGNLQLKPRDMAKLGALYLNGGTWNGERIISQAWVEASAQNRINPRWADGYGYQWWMRNYHKGSENVESFYAAGWGGQRITVFPELAMVVVFTGGNYVGEEPVDEIIVRHILPAVR